VPNAELVAAEKVYVPVAFWKRNWLPGQQGIRVYSRVARSKFPEGEEAVAPSGKS